MVEEAFRLQPFFLLKKLYGPMQSGAPIVKPLDRTRMQLSLKDRTPVDMPFVTGHRLLVAHLPHRTAVLTA